MEHRLTALQQEALAPVGDAPVKKLTGTLGTLDVVFTVLAYNAPIITVVGFIPFLILLGNGLGAPVTFVVCGGILLLFAVGFTTMAKYVPNGGAYYAYISMGLGKSVGLGSAMLAILSYIFMIVGGYCYAGVLDPQLLAHFTGDIGLPWWCWSLGAWVVISILAYFSINLSAKVLTVALACEVLAVVVWEAAVIAHQGLGVFSLSWLTPGAIMSGSLGVAILYGVTSFAGFEATAVFREEARNPDVTIPRATYIAIIAMALLFMSFTFLLIAGTGPEALIAQINEDASIVVRNSFGNFLGDAGIFLVDLLVCTSVFASGLAVHNVIARYIYSLSLDGVFPKSLAEIHSRFDSPSKASLATSAVVGLGIVLCAVLSLDPYIGFGLLVGMSGFGLLTLQTFTSLAILAFFAANRRSESILRALVAPALSFIILIACDVFAGINIGLLTGSQAIGLVMLGAFLATLAGGSLYGLRLRATNLEVYRAIGRQKL